MGMNFSDATSMPSRQPCTLMTAEMHNVFGRVYAERNTTEAANCAEAGSPSTMDNYISVYIDKPTSNVDQRTEKKKEHDTYKVVFPDSYSILVKALTPQVGQSTGAGPGPRFMRGVAVWYCLGFPYGCSPLPLVG